MSSAAHGPIRFAVEEPIAPGTAHEIAPGVLWIRLPLPMRLDHVNVYALEDGDGWCLIDTGMFSKRGVRIWETLLAGPLGGRPVRRVICTHHHPDHVGALGWFAAQGAEVLMSRTAWLMARMLTLDVQEQMVPETAQFLHRAGLSAERMAARQAERPFNFADTVHPIPLGLTRITEGDQIQIGTRVWEVHLGHGHAPHHVTLWSKDLALTGDQIIPGISSNLGVYPTEPDADPVGAWFESCQRLSRVATDAHLGLPGHKLPFYGIPARLQQLISNHHEALERLDAHLSSPRSAAECFKPLFGREIEDGAYGLALVEAVGHLNHMFKTGRARRWLDADGVYRFERI